MNDTGKVGCYVVILLLMGVFYVCVHIAEFLIKYFTSWQILFGGFAIIALVFMAIALYAEHFKLPPRDNKYATLSYEKKKKLPRFKFYKIFWGVLFWLGIGLCILSCTCDLTSMEVVTTHETKEWNAKNIPIPYLKDRTQYVSNPDTVITQATVNSMNEILGKLESECGIQSIVVIVNHVENADVFRVAQDLGNNYGVGNKETNRGLVIVVAFKDRKYFIAPGQGLEADLTDAECSRLARTYLTPFMKADNPDGGMFELVNATYSLLKGKELPAEPDANKLALGAKQNDEDWDFGAWIFTILIFWIGCYAGLNEKFRWILLSSLGGTGYTGFGRDRAGSGGSWGSGWGGGGSF